MMYIFVGDQVHFRFDGGNIFSQDGGMLMGRL